MEIWDIYGHHLRAPCRSELCFGSQQPQPLAGRRAVATDTAYLLRHLAHERWKTVEHKWNWMEYDGTLPIPRLYRILLYDYIVTSNHGIVNIIYQYKYNII